jgi:hypothetical protein
MSPIANPARCACRRRGWATLAVLAAGLVAAAGAVTGAGAAGTPGGSSTGIQSAQGLLLVAPGVAAGDSHFAVTVQSAREVRQAGNPGHLVNEVTLQVVAKDGKQRPQTILFGGPQEDVRETLLELKIAAGQLVAATDCSFAVFDLRTARKRAHVYSSCNVAVSPDGRRVAYTEFQPHFMPPQASGSVILVLDVVPLATHTVFPQASEVGLNGGHLLSTWEDDLAKVHDAGELHWSPDGRTLLFFCIHGLAGPRMPQQEPHPYLVTVDLRDLAHSQFTHQEIARDRYLIPGAKLPDNRSWLFSPQGIEWLDGGAAVRVIPGPDAPWMKRDIVLKLPARS